MRMPRGPLTARTRRQARTGRARRSRRASPSFEQTEVHFKWAEAAIYGGVKPVTA
jgi:hypothetical protein